MPVLARTLETLGLSTILVTNKPFWAERVGVPRTLAVELGMRNPKVRVNGIHPGPVMFPPDTSETERQQLIESTITKSGNCPEIIAQAVEFLIHNSVVTGVCLPVDGGRSVYASEATSRSRPI